MMGEFMRLSIFLLGCAAIFATGARGDGDCRCWTPSPEDIAAVEAKIAGRQTLPLGSLDRYARYYAGTISRRDSRYIQGKLVPIGGNDAPGIHVVEGGVLPPLQGEGCVTDAASEGPGLSIKCARPGPWPPSDQQIAELEGLLQLPEKHYHLQDYARYYAGVTEGDRRIVIGVFLIPLYRTYWTPGIHIVSDVYFPIAWDAGCALVNVRYDPSSKEISSRCGESFGGGGKF
jgi:hypothetical protein